MVAPSRSDRAWAGITSAPWARFLRLESAGGVTLLVATVFAIVAANSPWGDDYLELWQEELTFGFAGWSVSHDLQHWINHGLMTLFFFAAGLEIKRELVVGELSDLRAAAVPLVAALGGIVMPAAVYVAIAGNDAARGWAVPVAADIAFVVGLLALFGSRAPTALKAFVLSLAIADDIGAITIIALAYTNDLDLVALGAAAVLVASIAVLRACNVRLVGVYFMMGAVAWACAEASGLHPTVAGVAIALIAPARPLLDADASALVAGELPARPTPADIRRSSRLLRESVSVADRLQDLVHPWTSYLIVPLFALANAGIPLDRSALADAANPITIGVAAGLAFGAPLGVYSFTRLALMTRRFALPRGLESNLVLPAAFLGGIGFTVALFIADLAFESTQSQVDARLGVLAGSLIAATTAAVLLHRRLPNVADSRMPGPRSEPTLDASPTSSKVASPCATGCEGG